MSEMSPSFRNIVRVSAFAGIVLLIVGFIANRRSAVPTVKAVHHQSGSVASGFKRGPFGTDGREDGRNNVAPPARSPLGVDIDNPEVVKEEKTQTNQKLPLTSAKLQFVTSTNFLTTTVPNPFNPTNRFPLRVGNQVQPAGGTIRSKVQPTGGTIRNKVQPTAGTQGQLAENSNLQPAVKYRQSEQLFKAKYKQSRFQHRNRIQGGNAPTNVHAQTPTGNERIVSGQDTGFRRYPAEYQQPPGSTGVNKPRDQDSFTRIPDLVKYNLDDSSQPRLPRKPASANENEILAKEFLIPGMVPGIIHYLWCGNRWFGFKQYLALDSAVKAIKPDKIIFHLEYLPQGDQVHYHQWWDDIVHDYPFLYVHQIDQSELDICNGPTEQRIRRMMRWLDYEGGGIFVSENTWFLDFKPHLRLADLDYALDPGTMNGYIILRAGIGNSTNFSLESMMANKALKAKYSSCASVHTLQRQGTLPAHTACMTVTGAKVYDFLTPMHVWELDTPFGRITRRLYYGTEEILKPKPSFDELVPNIGHMIWIGGGRMDFLFYLSLLSKLFVLKVDVVYIHGDMPPKGEYWEKLKQNKRIFDRIKFITRPPPYRIYQGEIEWYYRALMSDLIRVDIMIKYGGIYTDTDAIWTKPLSYEDRGYDAVASFDWVDWSYPYPDSVNFGLSYGKRNAPFWRIFRNSMRRLHNDVHGFTGVMMPYKLLEKYPHLLRIDKHLMAICYQQKCHPTYIADYHNETNNHVTTNSIPNWREDLNALHWTHPNPPEYANETTLMAATGMFADVGRFVLQSAGLI